MTLLVRRDIDHHIVERFLLDPSGSDARVYEISDKHGMLVTFLTGGVNGKIADDTAIGNLADMSERHYGGELSVYRVDSDDRILLATAEHGCYRMPA